MTMHTLFISLACASMVCVTPPVEVPPKEARHTSMQTRALILEDVHVSSIITIDIYFF